MKKATNFFLKKATNIKMPKANEKATEAVCVTPTAVIHLF